MTTVAEPLASTSFCALCQSAIAAGEETHACSGCATVYHAECWREVGGCGMYGCSQVPPTEKRDELEIPAAFWGRDSKPCPACGKEIKALAVRCRFCQAELRQAGPQSRTAWREYQRRAASRPQLERRIIWLAIGCAVPVTATIAGIIGGLWWVRKREDIGQLSGLYQTLAKVGLAVAGIQTLVILTAITLSTLLAP